MSYTLYRRGDCHVAMNKEVSRRDDDGIDESYAHAIDDFFELDLPKPRREFEERFPVNKGRNVGRIGTKGFPAFDGSITTDLQTAIFLYYILGGCTTSDETTYFKHLIRESDIIPTFALHIEELNSGSGNDIIYDVLGCIATELSLTFSKDELVQQTLSFLATKSVTSSQYNTFSDWNFDKKVHNWEKMSLTSFTINSVDLLGRDYSAESLDVTIRNEIDPLPKYGDAYMDNYKFGKREYEIKMMLYPTDDTLEIARDLDPADYVGAITIYLNRGTNDIIPLVFSNMYVSDYPNKIPNIDDKDVGVEVTFRNNTGTLEIDAEDDLDAGFYELAEA